MATTSLGLPLYDSTFAPDFPTQVNAVTNGTNALIVADRVRLTAIEADISGRYLGSTSGTGTTRLGSSSNPDSPAQDCGVTVTLASTRRLRIAIDDRVAAATSSGPMQGSLWVAYIAGGSVPAVAASPIAGVTKLGNAVHWFATADGTSPAIHPACERNVLLTAGTYTFFPLVQRISGGAGTDSDVHGPSYCAVYDAGPT